MARRRPVTHAQKDRFILEWMTDGDAGRAWRVAGFASNTKARRNNVNHKLIIARDHKSGQEMLQDPYVAGMIGGFRKQQVEKFAEEADATRFEIMDGYRNVYQLAITSGNGRELNAAVRSLDGMARMMGYLIEHKVIHHERSDKKIEQMKDVGELRAHIRSIVVELGEPTMRLLMGGGEISEGEIVDVTPEQSKPEATLDN